MYRKISIAVIGVLMLLAGASKAAESVEDILSVIPGEAKGFIYLSSIKHADESFQYMVKEMDLTQFVMPPMNSLSGVMKMFLMMTDGLNEEGAIIAVFMPTDFIEEMGEKMAILVPVTDGKTLLGAMGGQAREGGIWNVSLMGDAAVAVVAEKYVVLADDEETARAVATPKESIKDKLEAEEKKALEGLNAAVWFDLGWILEKAKPQIDGIVAMMTMMQQAEGGFGAVQADTTKDQVDLWTKGADKVIFGLSLSEAGMKMRFALRAKPDSELHEQMMQSVDMPKASLLQGLPMSKYVFAMGQVIPGDRAEYFVESTEPYFEFLGEAEEVDSAKLDTLKSKMKDLYVQVSGYRMSAEALPGGPHGLVGLSVILDSENSDKFLQLVEESFGLVKEVVKEEEFKEYIDLLAFQKDAESAGDSKVHKFVLDPSSKLDELDMDEEDYEEVLSVLGEEGLTVRMAAAGKKKVVVALGGGLDRMKKLIEQAGKPGAPLAKDPGVKASAAHMPAERHTEAYFALDNLFLLIEKIAMAVEEDEFPVKLGELNAPAAMTGVVIEDQMNVDLFIPTAFMVAVKDTIMTFMGMGDTAESSAYQDF
jgi:hypothetical protein